MKRQRLKIPFGRRVIAVEVCDSFIATACAIGERLLNRRGSRPIVNFAAPHFAFRVAGQPRNFRAMPSYERDCGRSLPNPFTLCFLYITCILPIYS